MLRAKGLPPKGPVASKYFPAARKMTASLAYIPVEGKRKLMVELRRPTR